MKVPLTVNDFLRRAELVYADRIGVIDEPDQPAASWGELTWRQVAERKRAQAAGLDALGIGQGERVAIVSQNSARLLTSFFGVSGSGRILVPVNFRLAPPEVEYIVEHCGARVLLVDPELDDALSGVNAEYRFVIGADSDEVLYRFGGAGTVDARRGHHRQHQLHERHDGPAQVQLTHRNIWVNATTFGWHMGVNDRDVYLHTLPQFLQRLGHAVRRDRDGRPSRRAAQGGRRGDPAPRRAIRRHPALRRAAVLAMILDACVLRMDRSPARAPCGWWWPALHRRHGRSSGRRPSSDGSSCRSTASRRRRPSSMNRGRAEYDDLNPADRSRRLVRTGAPTIGVQLDVDARARSWPAATS